MTIINTMNNLKDKILHKNMAEINSPTNEKSNDLLETTINTETINTENSEIINNNSDKNNDNTDLLHLALITDGAENTEINQNIYSAKLQTEIIATLQENKIPDSQIEFLTQLIKEIVLKSVKNIQEKFNSLKELMKLENFFGGEERFNEVSKQITIWATKNLPTDLFNNLNTTYLGVISLYNMMSNDHEQTFINQEFQKDFLTEQDLKSMMQNPKYWRDKDENFIRQIDDGWKYLDSIKS